jgi:transposase, IS5 family
MEEAMARKHVQPGFFDLEDRYAALSKAGDALERLASVVSFEAFRYRLEKALKRSDGSKGGRPPYDPVMMFKILVLQALYGFSDDQAEFMITDRLSFMRFLGLSFEDKVPDAKTIWLFRELLIEAGALQKLFDLFDERLSEKGYLAMGGQIVDATVVEAPRQRNTDEEKREIKEGRVPEEWKDQPHKLAQKDMDARWTLKRGRAKPATGDKPKPVAIAIPVFGYKNHIATDVKHGFIRSFTVSDAAAHDGKRLKELVRQDNTASGVWADTAYRSKKNEAMLIRRGLFSRIHHRRAPGKDLSEAQARANRARSKVRAPIEHVFAHEKRRMGLFVRTIGKARAAFKIGMANLAYNFRRFVWHERRSLPA